MQTLNRLMTDIHVDIACRMEWTRQDMARTNSWQSVMGAWQTSPPEFRGHEECPSSYQRQYGKLRVWWPHGKEHCLSLGPESQRQGRRVRLPTCPCPPAAGSTGRPGWPGPAPPGLQPLGWDAGPHFPEESRTRPGPDPEP